MNVQEKIDLVFSKETKNFYVYESTAHGVVGKLYFPKDSTGNTTPNLSFKLNRTEATQ